MAMVALSGELGSTATPTSIPFDSTPGCLAVNTSAGAGGGTLGCTISSEATRALASSRIVDSAVASICDDQSLLSSIVEPSNCSADSGRNCCPPAAVG